MAPTPNSALLAAHLREDTADLLALLPAARRAAAGGPGGATYSFAMYMYIKYSKQEVAYACAIAMIMAIIFGVIATLQIIYMRSKEVEL